ncbi:MAG: hypothetical protein RSB24_08395, partial [Akkermansia sp.]
MLTKFSSYLELKQSTIYLENQLEKTNHCHYDRFNYHHRVDSIKQKKPHTSYSMGLHYNPGGDLLS